MRLRIAGEAWDDDEPTISIVMVPDEASDPGLEIGEEDFIRVEPSAQDWRLERRWVSPEPAEIPRPPRVPSRASLGAIPSTQMPTLPPSRKRTDPPAGARDAARAPRAAALPPGRRPRPPHNSLPKFPTNPGVEPAFLAASPVSPAFVPAFVPAPAAVDFRAAGPAQPWADQMAAPVLAYPPLSDAPMPPSSTPPPPQSIPAAPSPPPPPAFYSVPIPPPAPMGYPAAPRPIASKWAVSPLGIIVAVSAAIVAALGTVALMVVLTEEEPSKPRRLEPAANASSPSVAATPPSVPASVAVAPAASAAGSSRAPAVEPRPAAAATLSELASKGDIDAMMQLRARKADERTADESLALARGKSIRKRAALDELAVRLRADLPLSADRENLSKLREYLDDGETVTDALAVLASIGTPMAVDMIFDAGTRLPARSEARDLVDDLLSSKEVRSATSPALAIVLDLRRVETCEDAWHLLPRVIEHADGRAMGQLERLRLRTGCGPRKRDDCFRCLRGGDTLDKAIRYARSRRPPEM